MLEFFRQHVGGIFGLIIIGALVLAFSLSFGSQSRGWGQEQSEHYAASVDGIDIPDVTFKYAFNISGGRSIDSDDAKRMDLQRSVLNGLIERQLLLGVAKELGISASTDAAESRIADNELYLSRSIEDLAKQLESNMFIDPIIASRVLVSDGHRVRQSFVDRDGKFDLESYQKFVRYHLQITEANFVEEQRSEIIAEQVRQILVSSVRISEDAVRAEYEREHDTVTIEYIRLIPSYFADRLDPNPEELAAWAAAHGEEVNQYYETNKFKYTNLEKMARASHILIKVAEDATDEEKAKAREKIDGLLTRARAGEDFGLLAKEYSEDKGSAVKGGDLGFNPRGRMVPEFDDAMFGAEPGTITDVVSTKYGFHVIKVDAFREGNITLEQATPEIADILYRRTRGEEVARATSAEFLTRLKAGEKLAGLVPKEENETQDRLGLKVHTSQPFPRSTTSIPGIGETPEIAEAAFKLTQEAPIPDQAFELRGDFYVIQLKERKKPSDEEYQELKGNIAETMRSIKQASWLRDQVAELKATAEKEGRIEIFFTGPTPATPPARQKGPAADTPLGPEGKASPTKKPVEKKPAEKKPVEKKPAGKKSETPTKETAKPTQVEQPSAPADDEAEAE
ncbi:MAG: hypothetical protein GY854_32630 [Deltaproteobacteria bacterium]|nr:hypothetical protein [Deltaproteobacteria bacterium]